jgi:hypothetical protein
MNRPLNLRLGSQWENILPRPRGIDNYYKVIIRENAAKPAGFQMLLFYMLLIVAPNQIQLDLANLFTITVCQTLNFITVLVHG